MSSGIDFVMLSNGLSAGCAKNVQVNFWSPESACVAVMFVWTFSSNGFIFLRGQALFHHRHFMIMEIIKHEVT